MAKRSPGGILAAALIWIILVVVLAVAYRFLLHPVFRGKLERATGSESQYKEEVGLALDSFSGYCVLRSDEMYKRLKAQGIKLNVVDDGADYHGRIKALQRGDVQMAVFTIDSLVGAGAALGDFPATIVMVIDETKGADAIVGYEEGVAALTQLNDPSARIVLTPNSPSEFLARIAIAHFNLPRLPDTWWIEADGAEEVYSAYRAAKRDAKRAYVLWEPYVSKALKEPGATVLLDSSQLEGYIVDVLVAQRAFLREQPDVVRAVVEAYLRSSYAIEQDRGMADLVLKDSAKTGTRGVKREQAEKMVAGIRWKNTLENYAHFGLLAEDEAPGVTHIEDMVTRIADVLTKTGALDEQVLDYSAHTLFYRQLLADMKSEGFHPGKALSLLGDVGPGLGDLEAVRGVETLAALSAEEWARLVPVGEMRIQPITFARGTARLNISSRRTMTELTRRLETFPQYYLLVIGHVRADGDLEANMALAQSRAEASVEFLVAEGLNKNRVTGQAARPSDKGGASQSVSFMVGQKPY